MGFEGIPEHTLQSFNSFIKIILIVMPKNCFLITLTFATQFCKSNGGQNASI